jgi:hypothetical protein
MNDPPILAHYAHHKCASTWLMDILGRISTEIGIRHAVVVDVLAPEAAGRLTDFSTTFDRTELRARMAAGGVDLVTCMNADAVQARVLGHARAVHVIRDPRDILVSGYFSHRNSHPTDVQRNLEAHRRRLRSLSVEDGLLAEMEFSGHGLTQLGEWDYADASILELRMEDLTAHPYDGILRIADHLGLLADPEPVIAREQARAWAGRLLNRLARRRGLGRLRRRIPATAELVLGTAYAQRFDAHAQGRTRGTEDVTSHWRKGIAGDWVNHFTPVHAEAFVERFGDLLTRLGYEADDRWTADVPAGPAAGPRGRPG